MASVTTPLAFGALGVATLLVISGLKGHGVGDVIKGNTGAALDPSAGVAAVTGIDGTGVVSNTHTDDGTATDAESPGAHPSETAGNPAVVQALIAEMDRMADLHSYYRFGGSHVSYSDKGPWDCSSAISQALHKVGLLSGPPQVSGTLMVWGESGVGKLVTVYTNEEHCYMVVNGRTWQWRHTGTMGGWTGPMPTQGYYARHPKGL